MARKKSVKRSAPKKKKAKRQREVQMWDGKWYLDNFGQHQCCDCALIHDVEYSIERGRIFTKWKRNKRATTTERKKLGISVVTKQR